MEQKLRVPKNGGEIIGVGFRFCQQDFRACVPGLPSDAVECFIVAEKEPSEYGFRITRPILSYNRTDRVSNLTCIMGNTLYWHTRLTLAKLYDEGYRAVRIEYDA